MLTWWVSLLTTLSLLLCPVYAGPKEQKQPEQPAPDLSRIVALVGPSNMGHGCPVSATDALTAGHVAGTWRGGVQAPQSYRGENSEWAGYLDAVLASTYEDAGVLRVDKDGVTFPSWYTLALRAPAIGERLWWVGFDWRKGKTAYQTQVFTAKVVTIKAGSIVLDTQAVEGSSGSCVLNAQGQVVGLLVWGHQMNDTHNMAVAVGLWPPWFNGVK
jgi:V8-like Glu-specific endopeptidase